MTAAASRRPVPQPPWLRKNCACAAPVEVSGSPKRPDLAGGQGFRGEDFNQQPPWRGLNSSCWRSVVPVSAEPSGGRRLRGWVMAGRRCRGGGGAWGDEDGVQVGAGDEGDTGVGADHGLGAAVAGTQASHTVVSGGSSVSVRQPAGEHNARAGVPRRFRVGREGCRRRAGGAGAWRRRRRLGRGLAGRSRCRCARGGSRRAVRGWTSGA